VSVKRLGEKSELSTTMKRCTSTQTNSVLLDSFINLMSITICYYFL
jgi:hypothetical protein